MRKNEVFDDITRILVSGMPRRQALRYAVGLVFGGLVFDTRFAQAQMCSKNAACPGMLKCCLAIGECYAPEGDDPKQCCPTTLCDAVDVCCPGAMNETTPGCCEYICCPGPPAYCCGSAEDCCLAAPNGCCADGENCCPGAPGGCCAKGQSCVRGQCCPNCATTVASVLALLAGPPTQLEITVQNATYGISEIAIATAVNCTVAPAMPLAAGGTHSSIVVTATKTDQSKVAQIALAISAPTDACTCIKDPIFTVLKLATGRWARQTFANIAQSDQFLTVTNADPGLERLEIWVNSKLNRTLSLKEDETSNLDLAAAMTETENTISFVGYGELGASANIMVVDTASATESNSGGRAVREQGLVHRHSPIWGPLAEETEENSHLHAADVMSQTVRLNFNGPLNSATAADPSIFTVEVNRKATLVGTVQAQAAKNGGLDLTLQLPPETLHSGDTVDVYWQGLRDLRERSLLGHVPLLVQ
jgi:hypothetical protein